ncbi:MAG: hypothetical protein GVY34_06020 [Alphaproteobacteria bacterium]|jgi:hypothetical protein|nr:hypothetical protein [Alphaproteobacteria bacterium]
MLNYVLPAAAFALVTAQAAFACEDRVTIDPMQARELLSTIANDGADPLDQFFAFDTLMCADQTGIRDLALRTGAASSNATIQGQVLMRSLFEMETIAVKLLPAEGLSTEHYKAIEQNPQLNFAVRYRDLAAGCLSFGSDRGCDRNSNLSVTGTKAILHIDHNDDIIGSFSVVDGGLMGDVRVDALNGLVFPAQIELF